MPKKARFGLLAAFGLSSLCFAAVAAAQPYHYTVTNIAAASFQPETSGQQYFFSGSGGRYVRQHATRRLRGRGPRMTASAWRST